jgi:aspartyl-tRNA(Asn)/glutamyl-tRNA(Gln) amidotransferase subunit B
VKEYLNGKTKVLGWFMGQLMTINQGKADPEQLNQILVERIKLLKKSY